MSFESYIAVIDISSCRDFSDSPELSDTINVVIGK